MNTISDILMDIDRGCLANNMIEDCFTYRIVYFVNRVGHIHSVWKSISSGSRENVTVIEIVSIADMQDKRKAGYTYMFNFRIINTADGNQIIDRNLKTPYEALTPTQMMEYMEMDNSLAFMDRMERKAREKAEHMRRVARNPFYRLACMVGLM